jgi:hypothetical protein
MCTSVIYVYDIPWLPSFTMNHYTDNNIIILVFLFVKTSYLWFVNDKSVFGFIPKLYLYDDNDKQKQAKHVKQLYVYIYIYIY